MAENFRSGNKIRIILLLALFNLIFLGTEYVFVNLAAAQVNAEKAVLSQNYVLGISVAGFLLFPLVDRLFPAGFHRAGSIVFLLICMGSFLVVLRSQSYPVMLTAGCILFVMLGLLGSKVLLCDSEGTWKYAWIWSDSRHSVYAWDCAAVY